MSKGQTVRKTVRLSHPNPLFERWLGEWRDEAVARGSDLQYAFAKALKSLKKYPLPLNSGKECAILEHFGTRICLLLDRKLSEHSKNPVDLVNSLGSDPSNQNGGDDTRGGNKAMSPRAKAKAKRVPKNAKEKHKPPDESCAQKGRGLYVPTLRSAAYAVLVSLHRHAPPGDMSKGELQKACQPLCDTSMFKPVAGSRYCGWSAVGQLINRGLVVRAGNPHRYSLTTEGVALAEKLPVIDVDASCFGPSSPAPPPPPPAKSLLLNQPSTADWRSSEASASEDQLDELPIFTAGSFVVTLIVDTQEIHKGDELVRELDALGARPEVRKLSAGDFAWVARDAAGQELLLPFVVERKRLDDLASSIKDGRFHEQKFRLKQSGVCRLVYLVESHGGGQQRQYSLPSATLQQAAINTQFVDGFCVKHTRDRHDTVTYLAAFTRVLAAKFTTKMLIGCKKCDLPTEECDMNSDCISLMTFNEFNKLSTKTRKYTVREMLIKQMVQLRGMSVAKALAVADRWPGPRLLAEHLAGGGSLAGVGPALTHTLAQLYTRQTLS